MDCMNWDERIQHTVHIKSKQGSRAKKVDEEYTKRSSRDQVSISRIESKVVNKPSLRARTQKGASMAIRSLTCFAWKKCEIPTGVAV